MDAAVYRTSKLRRGDYGRLQGFQAAYQLLDNMGALVLKFYPLLRGCVCGNTSMCDGPHAGFPRRATRAALKGEWPYTKEMPSGAAPTSPPEGVFRHKRLMELDELPGRTTGRLGNTWPTTAHAMGGTATLALRNSNHLRNCRRQHSSSVMMAGRRELLEHGHRRRIRRGSRTFLGIMGRTEHQAD